MDGWTRPIRHGFGRTRAADAAGRRRSASAAAAGLFATGCGGGPSILDPRGEVAERIATLGWIHLVVVTAVFVVVLLLLLVPVLRSVARPQAAGHHPVDARVWIVGGAAASTIILAFLFISSLPTLSALSPPADAELVVEVVGHRWWWEVRYPAPGATTANEVHIPAGRQVLVRLTTADVIHSFWAPQLGGKLDLIPGNTNVMRLHADRPGTYRGACAEYCGLQHAHMRFLVVALSPEAYEAWIRREARPARPPTDPAAREGLRVFLSTGCASCHTIRGTPAAGKLGPDLTHLASRATLGAGALPNRRGHLAGWILNSQAIKPGNLMPDMPLTGPQLQALLAYLATLE